MANQTAFCTQCGAPRGGAAKFCTKCGAAFDGSATRAAGSTPVSAGTQARPAAAAPGLPMPAVAVFVVLLAAGGTAAYFAMGQSEGPVRAVAGNPGMPAAEGGAGAEGGAEGLPQGHPSIELPKEVTDFLDQLAAEADKNPTGVEPWQRLTRARYRASVINQTYRGSAQQALDKLMALDPANLEGLRISANLAYDAGDFPEAQKRFEVFLAKAPDDPSAITDLGSTLLFQDHNDEAMAQYRLAISKDPKFLQAHFNLAIALQKSGKSDEALAELRQARALADTPEQQKQVDNAIAEMEGRPPEGAAVAEGGRPGGGMPPGGAPGAAPTGMPGGATPPGGMPPGAMPPGGMPPGGMGATSIAPVPKPTNASTDVQREVEVILLSHSIVGPRIQSFQWTGDGDGRVLMADFPMDKMPPFARDKFKGGMNDKITKLAAEKGLSAGIHVDIVDAPSGRVMDSLGASR